MNIRRLGWRNLLSNPLNTVLSLLLMTFGVGVISLLLLLNNQIEQQIQYKLRGIDMVVGAKGIPLQLIHYSKSHEDNPTCNILSTDANKLNETPLTTSRPSKLRTILDNSNCTSLFANIAS